jgi:hypothetical protein
MPRRPKLSKPYVPHLGPSDWALVLFFVAGLGVDAGVFHTIHCSMRFSTEHPGMMLNDIRIRLNGRDISLKSVNWCIQLGRLSSLQTDSSGNCKFITDLAKKEDCSSVSILSSNASASRIAPPIPGLFFPWATRISLNLADELMEQCMNTYFQNTATNQVMLFQCAHIVPSQSEISPDTIPLPNHSWVYLLLFLSHCQVWGSS